MKETNADTTELLFLLPIGKCVSDDPAVDIVAKTSAVISHPTTLRVRGALLALMLDWYSSNALIIKEKKTLNR